MDGKEPNYFSLYLTVVWSGEHFTMGVIDWLTFFIFGVAVESHTGGLEPL